MSALASWRFERIGEREISVSCPTFSTPLVLSLDVCDRHLRAFYALAADLADSRETGARAGEGNVPPLPAKFPPIWVPEGGCFKDFSIFIREHLENRDDAWRAALAAAPAAPSEGLPLVAECPCCGTTLTREDAAAPAAAPAKLEDIEQYRMQMAAISTAALGYWKESDGILPDYDTLALRDVAKLYAKYDKLFKEKVEAQDNPPQPAIPSPEGGERAASESLVAIRVVINDLACVIEDAGKDAALDPRIKRARAALDALAAPAPQAPVTLTDEQIGVIYKRLTAMARATGNPSLGSVLWLARAVIAEFCRVNGIPAPQTKEPTNGR